MAEQDSIVSTTTAVDTLLRIRGNTCNAIDLGNDATRAYQKIIRKLKALESGPLTSLHDSLQTSNDLPLSPEQRKSLKEMEIALQSSYQSFYLLKKRLSEGRCSSNERLLVLVDSGFNPIKDIVEIALEILRSSVSLHAPSDQIRVTDCIT